MAHEFLSEDWFTAVEGVRDEFKDIEPPAGVADMKLNIVVTGAPAGDTEVHMSGGEFGRGLIDDAPTKLTVPYDVAKAVFVEGNQQAGMQAFMQGQIKVEGDMSRLMAMQSQAPDPNQQKIQDRIKEITA